MSGAASGDDSFREGGSKGELSERAEAGWVQCCMDHIQACRPTDWNGTGQEKM